MIASASERNLTLLEPLELDDIPEAGLRFEEPLPQSWLAQTLESPNGLRYAPRGPGRAEVEVHLLGPVDQRPPVRLLGRLTATVSTDCVRCLEEVPEDLIAQLDLTFFPEEQGPKEDAGMDGTYAGTTLPIPPVLQEMLLLELDMNPTCADEAACDTRTEGLLERVNRPGEAAMAEAAEEPDPRWDVLRKLRDSQRDPS
ncbi:MAG TPA: DUF177 domain-containing protein [Myxococcales bacterium LLY-WYZ-16_1]|nr:DUF177 domain-containing protein [Myxococcales bacterium LLY-WYZ-16_1]